MNSRGILVMVAFSVCATLTACSSQSEPPPGSTYFFDGYQAEQYCINTREDAGATYTRQEIAKCVEDVRAAEAAYNARDAK